MLTSELREKSYEYIDHVISLVEFEEWLVPCLPTYLASPDSEDADVVSTIELGFADVSNETRTEDEFRSDLKNVMNEHIAPRLIGVPTAFQTGSSTQTNPVNMTIGATFVIATGSRFQEA